MQYYVAKIVKQYFANSVRKAYTPPTREAGSTGKERKSEKVQYRVMSRPSETPLLYTIHAPLNSINFFAESEISELGLAAPAANGSPPRGFKPAKIHATKSTAEGTIKHAKDSGRPYMSYQPTGGQSSYSAPIRSETGIVGVVERVKTIATAKKEVIGPYGRIWFTPEYFVIQD